MTTHLPPANSSGPDDQLPGEAELAALYRQLPQDEPGATLDATILRAAAQAVIPDDQHLPVTGEHGKHARERDNRMRPKHAVVHDNLALLPTPGSSLVRRRSRSRWPIALGSAATLVLAGGLAWHMHQMPSSVQMSSQSDRRIASNKPVRATPSTSGKTAQRAMPSPPVPPPVLPIAMTAKPMAEVAPSNAAHDENAQAGASATATAAPMVSADITRETRSALIPAPMARISAAPASAVEGVIGTTGDSLKKSQRSSDVQGDTAAAAKIVEPEAPAAPAPAPLNMSSSSVPRLAPASAPPEGSSVANASDTPAQELDKILQLLAQSRDDEARQRLEVFHRTHPQWALPPELRAQLRKP